MTIPADDLLASLQALQDGAAAIAKVAKRGKAAERIERDRIHRMLAEHVEMLHAYVAADKGNFQRLMQIGTIPPTFLSAISAGPDIDAKIQADARSKETPAQAKKEALKAVRKNLPAAFAAVTASRTRPVRQAKPPRRPAGRVRRAPATKSSPQAGRPVSVAARPLGEVLQIVVQRGGNTFLHTFKHAPDLLAADAQGVLVIRGRFKLNPQGFIVG